MIRKGIIVTRDGMRLLGGQGSGNFGHAGIPGQRGGSAPGGGGSPGMSEFDKYDREVRQRVRDGVAKGFAEKTDPLKVEHGLIFGDDGKAITIVGNETMIKIPVDTVVTDMHFVHNHPGEAFPGLSPADVNVAVTGDMRSMTATGKAGIITIDRPPGGWPTVTEYDIEDAYKPEFARVREYVSDAKKMGRTVSSAELSKELRDSSQKALDRLGIPVKYVSRI